MANQMNPRNFGRSNSVNSPNRSNYDLNSKLSNFQYNPYRSEFNTSWMAKPSIDDYKPYGQTSIDLQRSRSKSRSKEALYSSREYLQEKQSPQHHVRFVSGSKIAPARPPPPNFSSRFSMENLPSLSNNQSQSNEMDLNNSNLYAQIDRNRVRDRRSLSPTRKTISSAYANRTTSSYFDRPMSPGLSPSPSYFSWSRSPSRSRDTSREPSPIRNTFTNLSSNFNPSITGPIKSILSNRTSPMNRRGFSSDTPQLDMSKLENRLEMEADHQFKAKRAQELRNSKIVNNLNEEQFSQAITDHFDQYKSLTSKIIGTKLNKQSGERKTIEIDQRQNDKDCQQEPAMIIKRQSMNDLNTHPIESVPDGGKDVMDPLRTNRTIDAKAEISKSSSSLSSSPSLSVVEKSQSLKSSKTSPLSALFQSSIKSDRIDRRNSSTYHPNRLANDNNHSNSDGNQQHRKTSLPADYLASTIPTNTRTVEDCWRREIVADMAHKAREKRLRPPESDLRRNLSNISSWFARQFVFLLISLLNICIAYLFYHLIVALPNN
ncbi:hypothetical protein SSS_06190 [Sarcoptes scabiei]|uniref:Uncharacterized protein n=1 Tax=Sarcoptes scabiei TaxID=52283 RepID=A0A834RAJ9_SARSC|nr:hypothetical protein SSS_06190 [Sarcoptes scabiei]